MILESRYWQVGMPMAASRRRTLRINERFKAAEHIIELARVEREIEDTNAKVKKLSDELGARYAVFRCELHRYDDGKDIRDTDIMRLSTQTDECIQSIYHLEQRRKELLNIIGR
jgi:hypothetical protein